MGPCAPEPARQYAGCSRPGTGGCICWPLVLVVSAGLLGWWQLEAWQERRAAEAVDLTESTPVPLGDALGADDAFPESALGRPVEVAGSWLPDETFLVADRLGGPDGATGSWVVTPVTVGDTGSVLPVVRGWVAADGVPPDPPAGDVTLVARLQPSDATTVADPDPGDDVLPALRIPDVAQRVEADLYSGYAVAVPGQPGTESLGEATLEQLPAPSRFTALRNLLYALEWWVFGLFAAFVWWRHVRDVASEPLAGRARSRSEPADEDDPGGRPSRDPPYPRGREGRTPPLPRDGHGRRGAADRARAWSACRCTTATCSSPTRSPRAVAPGRSAPTSRSTSASPTAGST